MSRTIESVITGLDKKIRIDLYLAEHFDYLSRSRWQKMVLEGRLQINNQIVKSPSYKVTNGDYLTFSGGFRSEPDVDKNYSIVFQDDNILIINKSGDLPVHPAGCYFKNSLTHLLHDDLGYQLFPVNRIDRETSGLVVLAKTSAQAAILSSQMSSAKKSYLVLVRGCFESALSCKVPLGPAYSADDQPEGAVRKKRRAHADALESAVTHLKPLFTGDNYSVVEALLETGRQHQIRAHLEYLGYPIVGDKIYGGDEGCYLEFIETGMTCDLLNRLAARRCMLHAVELCMPYQGENLKVSAPLPEDLCERVESLCGESCDTILKKIDNQSIY